MKNGIPVVLCVGSDKISGDSVGPEVGALLRDVFGLRCFVYGVPDAAVNGKTLKSYVEMINTAHLNSPIIAVDACLSPSHEVGSVEITDKGVCPKKALSGRGARVGDVGILGIVDKPSKNALETLMTVPWVNVEKLSFKIAFVLYLVLSVQNLTEDAAPRFF